MADISFESIYSNEKQAAYGLFLLWSNDFLDGFGIPSASTISLDDAYSFIQNLRTETGFFPANGGYDKASPFKKAANLYVWLHALNPFKDVPTREVFGEKLAKYPHLITTLIGFSIVKACLYGAIISRKDGSTVKLANPIRLSSHFFCDLVDASAGITPASHYKPFSLLFEALAYEANPDASYEKKF
ncbi:hypothetical protein OpiT1DRAFT_05456 [Opitutaceae bacterium TAV1]|nr:hypothetical protein OpiT1DRAFT_05456 [Opitutaceae bacterium TAV1]